MTSLRKRGFTLLELLISIAIIGLLAGITFPLLARSRHKARATACINNLRQIGIALQMYASDWDGCAPPYTTATRGSYMIGRGEKPDFIEIAPFNDRARLKACFAPYDAHYDELWRCPLHPDDPSDEDYEPETTYRVSVVFATQRPVKLDAPPTLSPAAFEERMNDDQWPGYFYWVDSDDTRMPIPHYLRCFSATVYDGSTGSYTAPPHGKTYPLLLLDGSVIHRSAEPAVFPSGGRLSW
ncbi:MAG: type II secretion system GspH family protein [Armatimonadetes bacterium]|nr:type II secretion system GspH family protein [Armatimonadota bacterium]